MLKRTIVGILLGALSGLGIGMLAGITGIGLIWLLLGLIEGLPLGELLQIIPWSIISGIITGAVSTVLGAITGGLLLSGATIAPTQRRQALVGALIGSIGGAGAATLMWDLQINGAIALIVTIILAITSALVGPLAVAWGNRVVAWTDG